MYITQACFQAVGLLSEDYYRGYFEDVDFCLRAHACGFRNVCAPSIYVGHAGTKSFGADKRALVMRNFDLIERRFPTYAAQSAAFELADPLRAARQAIERAAPPDAIGARLLITRAGVMSVVARERARQLQSNHQPIVILECRDDVGGPRARMFDSAGGIPQSLEYTLSSKSECEALVEYVGAMRVTAIEVLDPTHVPIRLIDRLFKLGVPHDICVANDAFLDIDHPPAAAAELLQQVRSGAAIKFAIDSPSERSLRRRWREIARTAKNVIVPSEQARAGALKHFAASRLSRARSMAKNEPSEVRRRGKAISRLGFVPIRSCSEEQALMASTARAICLVKPEIRITVLGHTLDDLGLMKISNTFVTGSVDPTDIISLAKSYDLQALFIPLTRRIFGHPLLDAASSSALPVAYFDWSAGSLKARRGDLALDLRAPLDDMIARLGRWLSQSDDV